MKKPMYAALDLHSRHEPGRFPSKLKL